ncbi:hypothetical protein BOTBODRAFT_37796 [Botryobasidium botryosum FD-172 SS1]|uniref:Cytochrome P450 n=1 Tax=Botryobasidium botryosum (strain FD-172 SS1) TaxID=930990 RepID=A0A067LYZ1_BOTB1|nr:hypothetical protein BOTBODRAFT_37796 [Botryobasidium botryosum FD-172 SS1]
MFKVAASLLAIFVISRVYKLFSGLKTVGYIPGIRCAFSTRSPLGMLLPSRFSGFFYNPGSNYLWKMKRRGGFDGDLDIVSLVPWMHGSPTVYLLSMELMQQVLGYSNDFDKVTNDPGIALFGENIAVVQKERWKVHRRVLNPAFSHKLHTLVWKECLHTFQEMVDAEAWKEKPSVDVPVINDLVAKFSLNIVSSCAFDVKFTWSEPLASSGERMSFQEAFKVVLVNAPVRLLVPTWAYILPLKVLKRVDAAFSTLFSFMRSQIALRREKIMSDESYEEDSPRSDSIFNTIIRANLDGGKSTLDDNEVIGNTFIMLFAGHETAARTLNATLALLGLYQSEQEKVYQEIKNVLADGREPTIEDSESFVYLQHCVQEAMRLYPPASVIIREAMHDVQLSVTNRTTGRKSHNVMVGKGALILINVIEIHYDPRHFPEPHGFKPSRWAEGTADSAAFTAFGQGPRACIGRKFALAEVTAFLVMLLRDWKVEIDLDGRTPEEWQRKMIYDEISGPRGLPPIPVRLSKRSLRP